MDGNVAKKSSNTGAKIGFLLLYLFLTGFMLLLSYGWGVFMIVYGFIFILVLEAVFGYSFAKVGLFKSAPVGIFLLLPLSMIGPMIIMILMTMTEEGMKVCMDGCSVMSFGELVVDLFIWYLIVWMITSISMIIAYSVTLKKVEKEDAIKQQIELQMQQEAAVKEAAEEKVLEELLKNRSEQPTENPGEKA